MKLNERQHRFVNEYIIDLNATQAAIRAGYSQKTAYSHGQRLLKHVEIKKAIDAEMEKLKSKRIADQQEILELLTGVARGETRSATLIGLGGGEDAITNEMPPTMSERIKAAELLGKRYALWTDKQQMDVTGVVSFVDDIGDGDEG